MDVKTVLVTQARMSSTRLPGKVLMEIENKPILKIHLDRLSKCKAVSNIIVATTTNERDLDLTEQVSKWGYEAYRGSEDDVLDRFYSAVEHLKPDWIVRVTSDCPLIDPNLVDKVIKFVRESDKDYGSNTLVENFPDGQDIEVFKFSALKLAWETAKLKSEREHVTPFIRDNCDFNRGTLFSSINYPCQADYSNIRMTVDEKADYDLVKMLIQKLGDDKSWLEYVNHIIENDMSKINGMIVRNEGLLTSIKND
jgi:spore coat polysaccharide biosynthesis protein SpsF